VKHRIFRAAFLVSSVLGILAAGGASMHWD
jgi:hypothetical protein